ncbi:hypothetical protein CW747_02445 [Staphylococcus shinii]|uniref:hypothetical protein n=1 Tax=Staphylococcus shinii TaxID=2912228 RepID=UPI000C33B949|nr:hypothetical protein [Staphylococcus shinii]PKI11017.1 hypothetical protein CW747_02445 [Staphylococcus shinii]
MAYEYESKLKNRLLDLEFDTWEETAQFEREYRELERVYRKAKAFDEIRKIEDKYYEEHGEFISTEDFVYAVDAILNNYKRSERADDER